MKEKNGVEFSAESCRRILSLVEENVTIDKIITNGFVCLMYEIKEIQMYVETV